MAYCSCLTSCVFLSRTDFQILLWGVPKIQGGGGVPTPPYFFYFELSETHLSAFSAFEVSFASRFTVLLLIQQNEANHYISC